ncbi:MAG TPA: hypothetical protein VHN20_03720, partial [Beijerinckiaceae bacterium]|nr:hypothetical protein [Beijerinckiaceae bacterium]
MTITRDVSDLDRAYGAAAVRSEASNNFLEQLMIADVLANRLEAATWAPGSHFARSPTMQGVVMAPGQIDAADPRFVNAYGAFRDAFEAVRDPKSLARLDPARAAQVLSAMDAWEAVASGLARGVSQGAEYWGNRDAMGRGARARHDELTGVNRGVATKVGATTFGPLHSAPMTNVERAAMMAARSRDHDVPLPAAAARTVAALGLGPMTPETVAAYESIAGALPAGEAARVPAGVATLPSRAPSPSHDPSAFAPLQQAPMTGPVALVSPSVAGVAAAERAAIFAPDAFGPPSTFEDRTFLGPDPSRFTPDPPGISRRGDAGPLMPGDVAVAPQIADELPPGSF